MVGIGDGVASFHDVVEQFVLRPSPERDAFAHLAIQGPEILLDLAEVGQQVARHLHELLEAVPNLGLVQHRQFPGLDPFDLGLNICLAPTQVGDALFGIGLGTGLDLFQKVYQCQQARLRADEFPLREGSEPGDRLLGGGRQVVVGLVRVRRVKLAEPFLCGVSPLVEVLDCRLGELLRAESLAELEHLVLQGLGQFALCEDAVVGLDERGVQEGRCQGRVVRP